MISSILFEGGSFMYKIKENLSPEKKIKFGKAKIIFIIIFIINIPLNIFTDINSNQDYIIMLGVLACILSMPSVIHNVPNFNCNPNKLPYGPITTIYGCIVPFLIVIGTECKTCVEQMMFSIVLLFYNLKGNECIAKFLYHVVASRLSSGDGLGL